MPDQLSADQPPGRPTTQASHDAHAFNRFRGGLEEASRQEAPRLPPEILYGSIIALVAAIGLAFAPWVRYTLDDGTTITESGIRGDGLVLVLTALISIGALVIAGRREPGDASIPALIGFGFSVIGLLAVSYTMMDPGYIQVDTESQPISLSRGWGLIGGFLAMLTATWGAFRLWRIADHFWAGSPFICTDRLGPSRARTRERQCLSKKPTVIPSLRGIPARSASAEGGVRSRHSGRRCLGSASGRCASRRDVSLALDMTVCG